MTSFGLDNGRTKGGGEEKRQRGMCVCVCHGVKGDDSKAATIATTTTVAATGTGTCVPAVIGNSATDIEERDTFSGRAIVCCCSALT